MTTVLDDVAQAIRATDLARGLDPASSDEYDTRARSCVSADLPWQDLAEEAGLQSPENIDSQGFRTVAQVIPGTLSLVQFILSHVCLEIPIWMPGEISTTGRPLTQTTQHQREALGLWPTPPQVIGPVGNGLVQRPWAASQAAQLPRPIWAFMSRSPGRIDGWYNNKPECSGRVRGSGTVCDEFPLNTTVQGKAAVASDNPYPSIKFVNGLGVSHEGNAQFFETNDFYSRCRIPRAGGSFLLIPQPPGGATPPAAESFFICD